MLFLMVSLFAIIMFAIVLDACVALALWLAFGRTNLFFRMPIFLAALTLPGVFCALLEAGQETFIVLFLAGAILIGAMVSFRSLIGKVAMGVLLAFLVLIAFCQLPLLNTVRLDPALASWTTRFFFATSVMAILFSITRLLGFDVVRLLDGIDDLELERQTGRSLDSWIGTLKNAKAEKWNRASLCRFLGNHGLDFRSQKDIAIAFEKVHGRREVGTSLSGNAQVVAQASAEKDDRSWFQRLAFEQFGLAQLLMLTFCAACFFRVTGLVYKNLTTLTDFFIAVPLPILVTMVVMTMLVHFLSVGKGHPKLLGFAAAIFLLLCVLLHFAERRFGSTFGMAIGLALLSVPFTLAISALLVQARHRGYRLVKVQRQEVPVGEAEPSSVYQLRRLPNANDHVT